MVSCQLYALHGFLGQPSDWEDIFRGSALHSSLKAVDLFKDQPILSFEEWTAKTGKILKKDASKSARVLIGYSLGGRLALHLALHEPKVWDAIVIISAHMGLSSENDRHVRLKQDNVWAQHFEEMPWDTLMQQWNGREVFQQDNFAFERKESDYDRSTLAAVLRCWSLGNQQDLSSKLSNLTCPILWIAGADDRNYAMQAQQVVQKQLLQHPNSKVCVVPECGHRVPWQKKEEFMVELTLFLERLNNEFKNDSDQH